MISSSNATPDLYWDGVILTCKDRFYVEVIENSAVLEGKGATSGAKIPDAVNGWATIGYSSMNGDIPGCYGYSQIATVRLKKLLESDHRDCNGW